jgi:hypothetical protein
MLSQLGFWLTKSAIKYFDSSTLITQFIDFYFCEKIMSLLKVSLTLATAALTAALTAGTPAFAAEPISTNDIKQTTIINGNHNQSSNSSYQTQRGVRSNGSKTSSTSQKTDQLNDIQGNSNHTSNTSKQVAGGATQRRGR